MQKKKLDFCTTDTDSVCKQAVKMFFPNRRQISTLILLNLCFPQGPSFIFYNCARLSALFKEFDSRVSSKVYSGLPSIDKIDFTLLNQPVSTSVSERFILIGYFLGRVGNDIYIHFAISSSRYQLCL
jgi:hypothetical protein